MDFQKVVNMIRQCEPQSISEDFEEIYQIINDAAQIYREIIPAEHYHIPYMSKDVLEEEIKSGITFWGYETDQRLVGVMGMQPRENVTLIRHAYVKTGMQHRGIGGKLLTHLYQSISGPVLIGTWADAFWAIQFYQKFGFHLVSQKDTLMLLDRYWTAPKWHKERSAVLADPKWIELVEQEVGGGNRKWPDKY